MSKILLSFLTGACLFCGARIFADQTNTEQFSSNTTSSLSNTDAINAYVQIQAQLHETQMMLESNRQETVAVLEHNAEMLTADIQMLEKTVAEQRAKEAASVASVEYTMLMIAGIGMLALAAVVTLVFLQLRTATRLIEMAMAPGSPLSSSRALPVVEATGSLPASARAALEYSNARLLGVIERLEKRILELEETVRIPLSESTVSGVLQNGNGDDQRVADLIAEGQLFLDTNKPEKALDSFNEALDRHPNLGDALIKKAAALEKLERVDEALACFDRAIEFADSTTTALLQKGGMLNRLARYDEALQCYERALQTQEKKAVSA